MKATIKNFTGANEIEVEAHNHEDIGGTVMLWHRSGAMNFQFNLTAADARLMASALMAAADEIEEVTARSTTFDSSDDMLDSDDFAELHRVMDKDND